MRKDFSLAAVFVGALAIGCGGGRKGSVGFHMPYGDPAKGKVAFASLKCYACHRVAGEDLPPPVADPPVPVVLGGKVSYARTDGELAAAILEPSHKLASGHPRASLTSGSLSRMGEFSEAMTARELIDLVAFLQSRYEVLPPLGRAVKQPPGRRDP